MTATLTRRRQRASTPRSWTEEDGIIRFDVFTTGTLARPWTERFKHQGYHLSKRCKTVLGLRDVVPDVGRVCMKIMVVKGTRISNDDEVYTPELIEYASAKNWIRPRAEVACLIRDMFSNKQISEMGLDMIVPLHHQIQVPDSDPALLYVTTHKVRDQSRKMGVGASSSKHETLFGWSTQRTGFAFIELR